MRWITSIILQGKAFFSPHKLSYLDNFLSLSCVSSMISSQPSSLRILCFGASITAGFHRFGLAHHPYALRLEERLKERFPQAEIDIDIDAFSGDRVIAGQYFSRLELRCTGKHKIKYDWIIMQGGGNDLGFGRAPERIYEELKNLWRIALDSGAKVLALTVTETADRRTTMRARYDALNRMIMDHKEGGFHVADVCSALPWVTDIEEQRRLWDDGLHFTPAGYDAIGDSIATSFSNPVMSKI